MGPLLDKLFAKTKYAIYLMSLFAHFSRNFSLSENSEPQFFVIYQVCFDEIHLILLKEKQDLPYFEIMTSFQQRGKTLLSQILELFP